MEAGHSAADCADQRSSAQISGKYLSDQSMSKEHCFLLLALRIRVIQLKHEVLIQSIRSVAVDAPVRRVLRADRPHSRTLKERFEHGVCQEGRNRVPERLLARLGRP